MKYIDDYYDKHLGQPGFVIGGGTSLSRLVKKDFDFNRIASTGVVVGTNKAYKLFTPDYLWFSDNNFWKTFADEIRETDCVKFYPAEYQQPELGGVDDEQAIPVLVERTYRMGAQLVVNKDDGRLLITGGSGVCGLRIADYLGLNPIYLLGMDCQPDVTGNQHFHTDYDDMPWTLATPGWYERSFQVFKNTIERLEAKGIQIVSCSQYSLLNELIPYKSIATICKKNT